MVWHLGFDPRFDPATPPNVVTTPTLERLKVWQTGRCPWDAYEVDTVAGTCRRIGQWVWGEGEPEWEDGYGPQ